MDRRDFLVKAGATSLAAGVGTTVLSQRAHAWIFVFFARAVVTNIARAGARTFWKRTVGNAVRHSVSNQGRRSFTRRAALSTNRMARSGFTNIVSDTSGKMFDAYFESQPSTPRGPRSPISVGTIEAQHKDNQHRYAVSYNNDVSETFTPVIAENSELIAMNLASALFEAEGMSNKEISQLLFPLNGDDASFADYDNSESAVFSYRTDAGAVVIVTTVDQSSQTAKLHLSTEVMRPNGRLHPRDFVWQAHASTPDKWRII